MEDAYWSLSRARFDLTQTRFDSSSEIKASQLLVDGAMAEVHAAMVEQDCYPVGRIPCHFIISAPHRGIALLSNLPIAISKEPLVISKAYGPSSSWRLHIRRRF